MKYIILGKNIKNGKKGDDSSNLFEYFELGWESIGSRFDFISLLNRDEINDSEYTAVTIEDRIFLYQSFFKNVISYDKYLNDVTINDITIDWTKQQKFNFLNASSFVDSKTKKYIRHEMDYEKIFNGFLLNTDLDPQDKYIVMCIRFRDHCSFRDSRIEFFKNLIEKIKQKIPNIYIVGKGTEEFCKQNDCKYIEKLQNFVTLIKNKKCLGFVTQSTGPAVLALTSAVCPIYIIDHARVSDIHGDNAVLGGKCIQLCTNTVDVFHDTNELTENLIVNRLFQNISID